MCDAERILSIVRQRERERERSRERKLSNLFFSFLFFFSSLAGLFESVKSLSLVGFFFLKFLERDGKWKSHERFWCGFVDVVVSGLFGFEFAL